jgi:hypothetical protein
LSFEIAAKMFGIHLALAGLLELRLLFREAEWRKSRDAYLLEQGRKWSEGKQDSDPLPANLRERLTRAKGALHASSL